MNGAQQCRRPPRLLLQPDRQRQGSLVLASLIHFLRLPLCSLGCLRYCLDARLADESEVFLGGGQTSHGRTSTCKPDRLAEQEVPFLPGVGSIQRPSDLVLLRGPSVHDTAN